MVLGNNESVGEEDDYNNKADQATWLEDLSWRVNKMKLEEANTRRFLKAPPRFLPYAECRAWVRAWNRWDSERDWRNWIALGEKRNSYIPSRPDEYYGRLGQWISWDHFLGKETGEQEEKEEDDSINTAFS